MNASAANALLKTLEEPPELTHFVLVTDAPSRLPITILSRCQRLRFAPLEAATIAAELERGHGLGPEQARLCAALAEGSLGRALALEGESLAEWRAAAERIDAASRERGMVEAFGLAGELARDKEGLRESLALLRVLYRDALLAHETLDDVAPLVNADRRELVHRLAGSSSRLGLTRRLHAVASAEGGLQANANPQLLLDHLILTLRDAEVPA